MADIEIVKMDVVRGDATGLSIPAHGPALQAGGTEFLTRAFHAFGSIAPDNEITRITRFDYCAGGSTGHKYFLSVEYAQPDPALHTDLFVKFSRDFDDPVRDNRGKYEMEGEIRFATISRLPGFPINVPPAYFADYHHESNTGVLITQMIPFGRDGIEQHHPKCMDHEIEHPIEYYRIIIRSLARIVAAHKAGRLPSDIADRFPFHPEESVSSCVIPFDAQQLRVRVAGFAAFVAQCPQLFPANINAALFAELDRHAGAYVEHQAVIRAFLCSNPDLIALCHWNANIDNCWFWRDEAGALQCGLMDWGHAGQLNIAFSLWGCLSGAGMGVWNDHLEELLDIFVTEIHEGGGPLLDVDEVKLHFGLYVTMMGLSYFIESNDRILFRFPEVIHASSPFDPAFQHRETARNQLQISTAFLNFWERHKLAGNLDRVLDRLNPDGTFKNQKQPNRRAR